MSWCFAIVNNRLAEIFFDEDKSDRKKISGHCYVKKEEYKSKQEQKWIEQDTKRVKLVWRNKKYKLVSAKK